MILKRVFTFSASPEPITRLKQYCRVNEQNFSDIVEQALLQYMRDNNLLDWSPEKQFKGR